MGVENLIKIIDSHEFIISRLKSFSDNLKKEDVKCTKQILGVYGLKDEYTGKDLFP